MFPCVKATVVRISTIGKSQHRLGVGPSRKSKTLSCSVSEQNLRYRQNILFPGGEFCGFVRVMFGGWCSGFLRADKLDSFSLGESMEIFLYHDPATSEARSHEGRLESASTAW